MSLTLTFHITIEMTTFGCLFIKILNQVTARWHPEDAKKEVLEDAPIFCPTEEVPTT